MNKAAIKRFAVWARTKLMADIRTRLGFVGITEDEVKAPLPSSTKEIQYFQGAGTEPVSVKGKNILARKDLAEKMQKDAKRSDYKIAYESLVETTASAWFNRLIAIRFMEVNDYLSDGIRMLSSAEAGKTDPDIVTAPFDSDLEFTEAEKGKIVQCKLNSETDRAFRILFFKRCHQLQKFLPGLFEKEGDATEFLMRLSVVDTDGVIYRLVHEIPEEDFRVSEGGQVEIIGWMYQYYNSELKDDTFAKLKKNIKVTKERIPSATQLFTPDWIVRYMVENSLGRLWIEHLRAKAPETDEKATAERFGWKYYLPEAKQEEAVEKQLMELRKPRAELKLENIRCIDPCMGSDHILSYLFDVLMQIYEEEGYDARDAVEQIVTKNLYGLDIDDRAGQLAYFTVMMKARQYDRRFFSRGIQPNVQAIQESNGCKTWAEVAGDSLVNGQLTLEDRFVQMADELIETFHNAKEYGSLLKVKADDYGGLLDYIGQMEEQGSNNLLFSAWLEEIKEKMAPLAKQAIWLLQKYDVVVTNPPYMGSSNMGAKLSAFVKKYYPDSKSDLFACFIERGNDWVIKNGYNCMVTMQSWMFLSSFEKMRKKILSNMTITNLMHMENMVLGIAFGTAVTAFRNIYLPDYKGTYNHIKLCDIKDDEPIAFPVKGNRFAQVAAKSFKKIPGEKIAYDISSNMLNDFKEQKLSEIVDIRSGISTGDNDRFYRLWYEVDNNNISKDKNDTPFNSRYKWFYIVRAGDYRKWWGDRENILNLYNKCNDIKNAGNNFRLRTPKYYNKIGVTWCRVTTGSVSFREKDELVNFGENSPSMFFNKDVDRFYYLGLLNSIVTSKFLLFINPTMTYQVVDIASLPILVEKDENKHAKIADLVKDNISFSKADWDSFETSWDFKRHPLV